MGALLNKTNNAKKCEFEKAFGSALFPIFLTYNWVRHQIHPMLTNQGLILKWITNECKWSVSEYNRVQPNSTKSEHTLIHNLGLFHLLVITLFQGIYSHFSLIAVSLYVKLNFNGNYLQIETQFMSLFKI